MEMFENVNVVKKANIFFEGGVASRTLLFADGSRKTLGIAWPGEYEFSTDSAEIMEILSGDLEVQLADGAWRQVRGGESFQVPAKSKFTMRIKSLTDYCCSFV